MIHAPMRIGLVGAGQRGNDAYGAFALADPGLVRFVAVAEPDPKRRIHFAEAHGIDPSARFDDITTLLGAPIELDGLIIATPDRAHVGPASAALEAGYPVLLEKPIATTEAEIQRLKTAVVASNGNVTIAHPLRYTAFFTAVDELLRGGAIGRLIGIEHLENIGAWHFAHSYVRGNWRRADESSPMILAKACHDLDILRWLADADCASVASFGSLRHFRPDQAPNGAPARCLDGCPVEETCAFSAPRFYRAVWSDGGWPGTVLTGPTTDPAALESALRIGPYGRCVYRCDNDVADHQVTILQFANGVAASLMVSAFTAENTRTIKLMGTLGELRGHMDRGEIEVRRFRDAHGRELPPVETTRVDAAGPHAGGDERMLLAFVEQLRLRRQGVRLGSTPSGLAVAIDSHRMAFAAERARAEGVVVQM